MWQWGDIIRHLTPFFNVYVPDLLFFGGSYTTRPERSESFQAQCVMRVMEANSVQRLYLVGISYGGFVAYSMAAQYREVVEKMGGSRLSHVVKLFGAKMKHLRKYVEYYFII